jgi:hypothetical protein
VNTSLARPATSQAFCRIATEIETVHYGQDGRSLKGVARVTFDSLEDQVAFSRNNARLRRASEKKHILSTWLFRSSAH